MFPPSRGLNLDVEAISGICGSVSIACWVVVFSPQIIENFRRSSAEGLSIQFVIIWLVGDVFNILGAVLQGVLPTMIILAVYYTFADILLLGQCFYYRGFTFRDPQQEPTPSTVPSETSPLLTNPSTATHTITTATALDQRSRSPSAFRERLLSTDAAHLSPATPMHPTPNSLKPNTTTTAPTKPTDRTLLQSILFNTTAIALVVLAGIAGYYLSPAPSTTSDHPHETPYARQTASLHFNPLGQIFGYICAVLYLGSRIPQLLLNYRRKSTEGLNALFFLFACIGNLTFVASILAFEPVCRGAGKHGGKRHGGCEAGEAVGIYGRYILVNLSWLVGSAGTLVLDGAVFVQFWIYRGREGEVAVLES